MSAARRQPSAPPSVPAGSGKPHPQAPGDVFFASRGQPSMQSGVPSPSVSEIGDAQASPTLRSTDPISIAPESTGGRASIPLSIVDPAAPAAPAPPVPAPPLAPALPPLPALPPVPALPPAAPPVPVGEAPAAPPVAAPPEPAVAPPAPEVDPPAPATELSAPVAPPTPILPPAPILSGPASGKRVLPSSRRQP